MKHWIAILLLIYTYAGKTQAYFIPETGYTTKSAPYLFFKAGYQLHNIQLEGGVCPILSRKHPSYFPISAGYEVWIYPLSFTPLLTVAYKLQSTDSDRSYQNGWQYGGGIRLSWKDIFLNISSMDNTQFVGIGFKTILNK